MYECNPSHTRRMDEGYLTVYSINSSQDKNNHIDGGKIKLTHSEQQFNEYFAQKNGEIFTDYKFKKPDSEG